MKDQGKTKRAPAYACGPYVLSFPTNHFEGQSSLFWGSYNVFTSNIGTERNEFRNHQELVRFTYCARLTTRVVRRTLLQTYMLHLSRRRAPPHLNARVSVLLLLK